MPAEWRTRISIAALALGAALATGFLFYPRRAPREPSRGPKLPESTPAPTLAMGGQSPPPGLYSALTAGGPIAIGLIAVVEPGNGGSPGEPPPKGKLTLEIEEKLRGSDLPDTIEVPFELRGADPRRPPIAWDRVPPRAGKRVCVILASRKDPRSAYCVLDLDGEDISILPILRRMLELETLPAADRRSKLLAALADPAPWIRALAAELFLASEARVDPRARSELLAALVPAARDPDRPLDERLQAVSAAGLKVYDGFTADDPVNYEVLSFLAGLLTDPSPRVRGEAVHLLHGYLLGAGTQRPSATRIQLGERKRTMEQLHRDIEDRTYFAGAAGELLVLFTGG